MLCEHSEHGRRHLLASSAVRPMDGGMEGQTMYGKRNRWMGGYITDRRADRWANGWTIDRWVEGLVDVQRINRWEIVSMGGWMDREMDGWVKT